MNFSSYQQRSQIIKRIILWSVLIGGFLALFLGRSTIAAQIPVFAQEPISVCEQFGNCVTGTNEAKTGQEGIFNFILGIVYFLIYMSTAISVLFIVYAAYLMITSRGIEEQYKNGISTLRNAVIGLILAILSLTIVTVISGTISGFRI